MNRFEKDAIRRVIREALMAHADERELPLTISDIDGLSRAAARGMDSPEVTVPAVATELTPMRREVLFGIAIGETAKETGRRLCLTESTIKTHRRLMFTQLRVTTAGQAVAVGIELGLITTRRAPSVSASAGRLSALLARPDAGGRS